MNTTASTSSPTSPFTITDLTADPNNRVSELLAARADVARDLHTAMRRALNVERARHIQAVAMIRAKYEPQIGAVQAPYDAAIEEAWREMEEAWAGAAGEVMEVQA